LAAIVRFPARHVRVIWLMSLGPDGWLVLARGHGWEPMRRFCLQRARLLTLKERGFLINIADWNGPLTERQEVWLNNIYARLRREAA
jgi:hypothetical protein